MPECLVEEWPDGNSSAARASQQGAVFEVVQIASNGGDGSAEGRAELLDANGARLLEAPKDVFVTSNERIAFSRHMIKTNKEK